MQLLWDINISISTPILFTIFRIIIFLKTATFLFKGITLFFFEVITFITIWLTFIFHFSSAWCCCGCWNHFWFYSINTTRSLISWQTMHFLRPFTVQILLQTHFASVKQFLFFILLLCFLSLLVLFLLFLIINWLNKLEDILPFHGTNKDISNTYIFILI